MIEEFGMGRAFTERAEVIHRRHDAAAEDVVPDAVDDGARHEWIGWVNQLPRQLKASARFRRGNWFRCSKRHRQTARRQFARLEWLAADENIFVDARAIEPRHRRA